MLRYLLRAAIVIAAIAPPLLAQAPPDAPEIDSVVAADLEKCIELSLHGRRPADYLRPLSGAHLANWQRSAKLNQPQGVFLLGVCRLCAIGVERDLSEGYQLCAKAADKGLPAAVSFVGTIHFHGMSGVPRDNDLAF